MEDIMIKLKNINKRYSDNIIFDDFNIDFYIDEINCILGKSGCGKSTLLNIISGIIENDSRNFDAIDYLGISYIFQEDRLIDWLTVEENIKLVVEDVYDKRNIDNMCNKYLNLVGMSQYKKYYPQMLSGGLRQRVNIARAFIYPSKIIIMDEPFKSIDIKNKQMIMDSLLEIQNEEKRTILFVTHDIDEALFLGDKIYILGNYPVKIKGVLDNVGELLDKRKIFELI
ncbi:MAG: ABC transporter ATP-binding protein [Romboutsia sp.]